MLHYRRSPGNSRRAADSQNATAVSSAALLRRVGRPDFVIDGIDHEVSGLTAELFSFGTGEEFPGPVRNLRAHGWRFRAPSEGLHLHSGFEAAQRHGLDTSWPNLVQAVPPFRRPSLWLRLRGHRALHSRHGSHEPGERHSRSRSKRRMLQMTATTANPG